MTKYSKKEFLKIIKTNFSQQPIIVPLADTVRDMMHLGKRDNEFYLLGAMGMPLSIATGIAMGLQKKKLGKNVVCIEGDGGLLMNINSLLTVKYQNIKNLIIILLDNESYVTTGQQPTYSSVIDLGALAKELGFSTFMVDNISDFSALTNQIKSLKDGPYFIHTKVTKETSTAPIAFDNPTVLLNNFYNYLQGLSNETD